MKNYPYTITFSNGKTEIVHCNNVKQAIVLGLALAHSNAWPMKIDNIVDEKGKVTNNVGILISYSQGNLNTIAPLNL